MAKLAKGRASFTDTIRTDPKSWNPLVNNSKTHRDSHQVVPSPLSFPQLKTPVSQREQNTPSHVSVQSSRKKRNRQLHKKASIKKPKIGSFSEQSTSANGDQPHNQQNHETRPTAGLTSNEGQSGRAVVPPQSRFRTVQNEQLERVSSQERKKQLVARSSIASLLQQKDDTEIKTPQRSNVQQSKSDQALPTDIPRSRREQAAQIHSEQASRSPEANHPNSSDQQKISNLLSQPRISTEQRPVFDKEPEIGGVYAASDADDESDESEPTYEQLGQKSTEEIAEDEADKLKAPIDNVENPIEEPEVDNESSGDDIQPQLIRKPQIVSDMVRPLVKQLKSGRFACPFADTYKCNATFSSRKSADRHANHHVDADKYKCSLCDKACARADSHARHMLKMHGQRAKKSDKPTENDANTEQLSAEMNQSNDKDDNAINTEHRKFEKVEPDGRTTTAIPPYYHGVQPIHADLEHVSVTSAEEESESDEDSKNEPVKGNLRADTNTQNVRKIVNRSKRQTIEPPPVDLAARSNTQASTEDIPPTAAQSNKRKRKAPLSPPSRNDDSPPPRRKRHRPETPEVVVEETRVDEEMNMEDMVNEETAEDEMVKGEMSEEGVESENQYNVASNSSDSRSESWNERESGGAAESDVDMEDVGEEDRSDEASDDEVSRTQLNVAHQAPRVMVIVPKLPKEAARHESISGFRDTEMPTSLTRRTDRLSTRLSRNGTLDSFVERSNSNASSTDTTSHQTRRKAGLPLAMTEIGESSNSRIIRSRKTKSKRQIDALVKDKGSKPRSSGEHEESAEEAENGNDAEDHNKPDSVARKESNHKGKNKLPTVRASKQPISSKNNNKAEDYDGDREADDDDDPTHSESEGSRRHIDKSDVKRPRRRLSKAPFGKRTGRFSEEEIAVLYAWRDSFCNIYDMSVSAFNDMMIASTKRNKNGEDWRPYKNFISKRDFLDQYYEQLPDRDRRAMIRFRERHFNNAEKTPWSAEDDRELRHLVEAYGTKWVEIAETMGRSQDAVHQRWRHKLNYGEKIAEGEWTENEAEDLSRIVTEMAHKQGKEPDESDLEVKWKVVSEKLNNGRTAQQCSNRWRLTTHKRTKEGFVRVPLANRIPLLKSRPRTPAKMSRRLTPKGKSRKKAVAKKRAEKIKSAEYVNDSDNETEGDEDLVASDGEKQEARSENEQSSAASENENEEEVTDDGSSSEESEKGGECAQSQPSPSSDNESVADDSERGKISSSDDEEMNDVVSSEPIAETAPPRKLSLHAPKDITKAKFANIDERRYPRPS